MGYRRATPIYRLRRYLLPTTAAYLGVTLLVLDSALGFGVLSGVIEAVGISLLVAAVVQVVVNVSIDRVASAVESAIPVAETGIAKLYPLARRLPDEVLDAIRQSRRLDLGLGLPLNSRRLIEVYEALEWVSNAGPSIQSEVRVLLPDIRASEEDGGGGPWPGRRWESEADVRMMVGRLIRDYPGRTEVRITGFPLGNTVVVADDRVFVLIEDPLEESRLAGLVVAAAVLSPFGEAYRRAFNKIWDISGEPEWDLGTTPEN